MNNVLRVHGLTHKYHLFQALKNVNINFYPGRIHAVIGPNGAGKTTLFSCMAGLLQPTSGTVESDFSHQEIGYLFENPPLYDDLKVDELIRHFCQLNDVRDDLALLKEWGLVDFKQKYVGSLSKGQKQKVSLALCFIKRPKIIILDEPLNGLDVEGKAHLSKVLLKYKKDKTIIISEHQLNLVRDLADDITILKQGEVVFSGEGSQLSSGSENYRFVFECLHADQAQLNQLKNEVKDCSDIKKVSAREYEISLDPNCEDLNSVQAEILKRLVNSPLRVISFSQNKRSLEEDIIHHIKE